MSDEERAREIVVDLVRQMRVTGASAGSVLAAALRHIRDARAEEREACAMLCELLADSATTDHLDFAAADDFREAAAAIRGRR